jgi:DNA-binding CsgD family transcriptional regulator
MPDHDQDLPKFEFSFKPIPMSLTTDDWASLHSATLRLYRELSPKIQVRTMLDVLNDLVPADNVVLNKFEVTTGHYEVVTLPEKLAKPDEVRLVGRYLNQSPFPPYFVATGDTQWRMTTDFMPLSDFHATDLWKLGLSRWGINQQCCGMLAFMNSTAHAVTINRTHRGFDERERLLLNTLHPHLVTSYVHAQSMGVQQRTIDELQASLNAAPGAYGYFLANGRLSWLQPQAREWLALAFPSTSTDNDGLPAPVRELVHQAKAGATSPLYLTTPIPDARLTICLLPSHLGGWIMRQERTPLSSRLRLVPIPGLSGRAQEVLGWMVEGKRNSEIATLLDISERTVEKHVETVLRAFNAENRATAIVRAMEMSGQQVS